ncbi:MAG: radical SAM protein [Thermoplasmata archaeon]
MIHVAIGTAYSLGLMKGDILIAPRTAHFLNSGKCLYDCAYCTRARTSRSKEVYLCRIPWPAFEEKEVFQALEDNAEKFQRVCLQVVNSENHLRFASEYVSQIQEVSSLPISVELRTKRLGDVERFLSLGAEYVGLPLDVASEELFPRIRGGSLRENLSFLLTAFESFGGRVGTHLIVGLGEKEEEIVHIMREIMRDRISLGLFAFTPCRGTRMENCPPPQISQYRRIQLARYLISIDRDDSITFDERGRISSFGLDQEEIARIPGSVFETQGCEGCNRPYYNERPVGRPYNYPRRLTDEELLTELGGALR